MSAQDHTVVGGRAMTGPNLLDFMARACNPCPLVYVPFPLLLPPAGEPQGRPHDFSLGAALPDLSFLLQHA